MLVVEPPASRFDSNVLTGATEEHLLERISTLENRLIRLAEKIEEGVSVLVQRAIRLDLDGEMVEILQSLVDEAKIVSGNTRGKRSERHVPTAERIKASRIREVRDEVLGGLCRRNEIQRRRVLDAAFALLDTKRVCEGLELLKVAVDEGAGDAPLASFVGELLFSQGDWELAAEYLGKALAVDAENRQANLMLGFIRANEGAVREAEGYLSQAADKGCLCFSLYFIEGRLLLVQGDHKRAIK
jgi:tetratricopeptide (TPR) repeat protein